MLFPEADDERFADSYAQTVTFALLLARSEGADVSEVGKAVAQLESDHALLSKALQVLADDKTLYAEIEPSLVLIQRVINAFPVDAMNLDVDTGEDPWLYFYEHFLAAYDPKLRKNSGVYYTPVEVVKCQVALVDDLLRNKLGKHGGFAHKDVITLDPAVGTGTYLLGVIDHALRSVEKEQGKGAVPARATALAANLYGFEIMTGPYAVSELRLTRDLKARGATMPNDGVGVYLADTLESPFGEPPKFPQFFKAIAEQQAKALKVKDQKAVIVCLGNPPYDRHDAVRTDENGIVIDEDYSRTGGWVRWGDGRDQEKGRLSAFINPARNAGHGGDLKNLYNLYVYFWRWALWKVFEHTSGAAHDHHGVVTFISASSYIRGDAFVGMREMLRRLCHDVYIIDLGGEGRGTRQDDNVFDIQTPVAICIAVRTGKKAKEQPATVRYTAIVGDRAAKYAALAGIRSFDDLEWKECPSEWHAPLRPAGKGVYFEWPLLTDIMPWQQSGLKVGRLWPISADVDTLHRRWMKLMAAEPLRRNSWFKDSPTGRKCGDAPQALREGAERLKPINLLSRTTKPPPTISYGYRSFDRQWIFEDARLIDRPGPPLWLAHSDKQLYLTTLFSYPLGHGPALTAASSIPDLDMFRGSAGAKANFPLFRNSAATEANILPGFLALWGKKLKRDIAPEQFAAYVYALLGHSRFVEKFWTELEDCELRVPLTLDGELFGRAVELGSRLLFLHTYGERFGPKRKPAPVPPGRAKCIESISDEPADYPDEFEYIEQSQTLRVGTGAIAPVAPEIWNYEVSGLQVVKSWLGYRMKNRKGKKSSPLDDIHPERWTSEFTDELLRLLWILEHSLAMQPDLSELLETVCDGPLLLASELPAVPPHMRKPPKIDRDELLFGEPDDDDADE